ncbi:MAG TPA: hypothetical protein VEX57_00480 [Microlunatus sp.]|nr:hypothetical protein [Microlunatus sp.]
MEILECTAGAVGASTMRVAAAARPAVLEHRTHLLPIARTHSLAGVGLYEVQGRDSGWGGQMTDAKDAVNGTDPISFPTRLGPPPDCPPVK